jgi:hypothetical protein
MSWKMFRAAMVLTFLAPGLAGAQSMEGWRRVPDAQLKFEADHAVCTAHVNTNTDKLSQSIMRGPPSFTQCMRGRGWVKGADTDG